MGIMDTVLAKHLLVFTNFYKHNKRELDDYFKNGEMSAINIRSRGNSRATLEARQKIAVTFRTEGNASFKKGDFQKARMLYTKSLAVAIGGELAAMAYANR